MATRVILWASTALFLAGCADTSHEVGHIRALPNSGGDFHRALQKDYADLSQKELTRADWKDQVFFADRASDAAAGETFPPQPLAERRIPAHAINDLGEARTRLMAALTDDNRRNLAAFASLAQTGFDCWMEEQEEDFQPDDIAACRRTFTAALAALEADTRPRPAPAAPAPQASGVEPLPATPFEVLFDFNSAALNTEGRQTVTEIGAAYRKFNPATVVIIGHTDSVGANEYNIRLSQKRAESVADALAGAGVNQGEMRIEAYGEERPAVRMPDGTREQRNRRVDVIFEK